jgi:predicted transcriptional regulator
MVMRKPRSDVPDAELAVLKALWERGPATIREIADKLYPGGEVAHYATVQKLLERLHSRGHVSRRRKGLANVFAAKVAREDLIRHRLRETADKLCEGSMTPLLTQLVQAKGLTAEEIAELRAMIDRLAKEGGPR